MHHKNNVELTDIAQLYYTVSVLWLEITISHEGTEPSDSPPVLFVLLSRRDLSLL